MIGIIAERKTFIRSFIKKIWIDYPVITIEYTIPISKSDDSNKEVLICNRLGCPSSAVARTFKVEVKFIVHQSQAKFQSLGSRKFQTLR